MDFGSLLEVVVLAVLLMSVVLRVWDVLHDLDELDVRYVVDDELVDELDVLGELGELDVAVVDVADGELVAVGVVVDDGAVVVDVVDAFDGSPGSPRTLKRYEE